VLSGCKKEKPTTVDDTTESSYKIYVDDALLTESTSASLSIIDGNLMGGSKGNNDITFYMGNVPEVGSTVDVDYTAYSDDLYNGGDGSNFTTFSIIGNKIDNVNPDAGKIEMFTGTVKRESKVKFVFEGTYYDHIISGSSLHDFHGEVIVGD